MSCADFARYSAAGLTQTVNGVVTKSASYAAAVGMFLFLASFSGFWLVPSWIYGKEAPCDYVE